MSNYRKIFFIFILAVAIFFVQISFINFLPYWLNRINLPLFFIICFFIFRGFNYSFYFSLFSGLIFDLFSFYTFGIYLLVFIVVIVLGDFFWNNFFTNRSIYSFLILSFLLAFFHNLLLYFLLFLSEKSDLGILWLGKIFWLNFLFELLLIFGGVIISFYVLRRSRGHSSGLVFDKNQF